MVITRKHFLGTYPRGKLSAPDFDQSAFIFPASAQLVRQRLQVIYLSCSAVDRMGEDTCCERKNDWWR